MFIESLVKIAGIGLAALLSVLGLYLALRLVGKVVKTVIIVALVVVVIFVLWNLFRGGSLPGMSALLPGTGGVFLSRFGV